MDSPLRDLTQKKVINNIWIAVWIIAVIYSVFTFIVLIYLIFVLPSDALANMNTDYAAPDIYPKRFGFFNVSVTVDNHPGEQYQNNWTHPHVWKNWTMWLSLSMILITLLFLVVLLGYARSQTRSWFNVNSYIRIILIMLISSITIYILGVTAIPHVSPTHPIDDDVYWDRNWESWIFKHNYNTDKVYSLSIGGSSLLAFVVIVSFYATVDASLGVYVSLSRYRDWVRHTELW